jgi:hypothetical protein
MSYGLVKRELNIDESHSAAPTWLELIGVGIPCELERKSFAGGLF